MATYTYNPLREAKAIRLVRLLPGSTDGIQCQLFRASLNSRNEYCALSYAWGDTKKPHSIICNGRKLPITDSLMTALLRLRTDLPDEPRLFWIDAICINQDDVDERNRQVALIPEIYQKAQQLLIWLGPGEKYYGMAMKLMSRFAEAQLDLLRIGRLQDLYVKTEEWLAWSRFLQRGWFERMWVIQELAMGLKLSGDTRPLFLCGVHKFRMEVLRGACEWCDGLNLAIDMSTDEGIILQEVQKGVKRVLVLCEMTKDTSPEEVRTGMWRRWLLSKVAATRDKKSTDPRDRLFALYGFLQDGDNTVAAADYNKTTAMVYHEFAQEYVLRSHCLDMLSEVEEGHSREMKGIPSWVPDWNTLPSRSPLLRLTNLLAVEQPRNDVYKACGKMNPENAIASPRDDVLLLDAVCVDEISVVSDVFSHDALAQPANGESPLLRLWTHVVSHVDPYPGGKANTPAIEAFYKTLIGGREEEDRHVENFIAYWKSLHVDDGSDLPTFCINTPEIVQLLCRRSAGAETVAQLHELQNRIHLMGFDTPVGLNTPLGHSPSKENFFTPMERHTTLNGTHGLRPPPKMPLKHASAQRYRNLLLETLQHRVFFQTKKGYMGIGVSGTEPGDLVCVLVGGKTPYVLRKTSIKDRLSYKGVRSKVSRLKTHTLAACLVGEAYVHGIMHGEALRRENEIQWDRIALV